MVKQSDIAKELGISEAAVSKAVAKGMPTDSIEAASAWRDSRPRRRLGAKENVGLAKITIQPPSPTVHHQPNVLNPIKPAAAGEHTDFDETSIAQAEHVQVSAFDYYKRALESNNAGLIAAAIKNWGEAGKVSATLRERYIEIREKSRQLIDRDEALAAIGIEIGEWRRLFDTLGTRLAGGRISAEAAKEVQSEIERVKRDMMPRAEMVARAMFAPKEEEE